jgi:phosphoribosyl 1,2-cyclic phosphodiesterase
VRPLPEKALNPAPDAASSASTAGDVEPALTLRCWGTRGSIPSPGPLTARYGGNTTCFEVRYGEQRLIFDAGSGIRVLGLDLLKNGGVYHHIFLTHFHWDHIQGFPFFPPLYRPDIDLKIIGPKQNSIDVRSLFAGQMGPIYFPVPFSAVAARMSFDHLNEGTLQIGGVTLSTIRVKHPSYVVGYRIDAGGRSVCFIPDNEVEGADYEVKEGWRRRLVDFIHGADILIHDSMYTEHEYPNRVGWGHSTFRQSVRLAEEGEVGKLLFFHHDPERSDAQIDEIVGRVREEALARGSSVDMGAAAEGVAFTLEEN